MKYRSIGGTSASAIGLGAMPLSIAGHPDERQAIATIHAALDAGITLIDTADAYRPGIHDPSGNGHNERIIAKALAAYGGNKDAIVLATKTGNVKPMPGDDDEWEVNGSPAYIKAACEGSLKALGVDHIHLYQLHRADPYVPFEDSIGAMMELQDAGKIGMIGISNVGISYIDRARKTLGDRGLASVQNEYSPRVRKWEDVVDYCVANGIAFLPWSPLGGVGNAGKLREGAWAETAARHGVSPQQIALAWLLAKGPQVVPIPGARRPETITDSAHAPEVSLTGEELARLTSSVLDA